MPVAKPARVIVIGLFVAALLLSGLGALLRLLEPQPVVPSHSVANARALRTSLLQGRLDPLLQHTVEIVTILKANYGKLVDSPSRMGIGVLVYVTTYFVVVERQTTRSGTGKMRHYEDRFRMPVDQAAAQIFYLPLHRFDRDYLRPKYWNRYGF